MLFRQSFDQLSGVQLVDGYDVVVCDTCGAGFADDIPPQSVFDSYYRELSKYEAPHQDSSTPLSIDPRYHDIARTVASFIPGKDARIFEIGCASGELLKALQELGFQYLSGSDPSPGCIRAARDLLGIAGMVGTVFTAPPPRQAYDFLILAGVIEHIRDLDNAVAHLHRGLADKGRIYLEVPDASRYGAGLDAPFQEFSIEHINFFSKVSLVNLMGLRGFRPVGAGLTVRRLHEITHPSVYAVFEKSSEPANWERDTETMTGLRSYIDDCRIEDARIRLKIRSSLPAGERMIVWGVGSHTLRLLAAGGLDPDTIRVFVDSDPNYQSRRLRGIPIVAPDRLEDFPEPILISSRGFQAEIQDQIRKGLGLKNPIILLYPP